MTTVVCERGFVFRTWVNEQLSWDQFEAKLARLNRGGLTSAGRRGSRDQKPGTDSEAVWKDIGR